MDGSTLYHLVYQSVALKEMTEEELLEMLKPARQTNQQHGITGILLYYNGNFLQALEGQQQEVEWLFAKICRDCRHYDVVTLANGPIAKRSFSDWTMGFETLHPRQYLNLTGFCNPNSEEYLANYSRHGNKTLYDLLTAFVYTELIDI